MATPPFHPLMSLDKFCDIHTIESNSALSRRNSKYKKYSIKNIRSKKTMLNWEAF
jgi:hypothetical protein